LIGLGALIKRLQLLPSSAAEVLNFFILHISLPAIILENVPKATINMDLLTPVFIHYGVLLLHIPLVIGISRLLKFSRTTEGALILVSTMGNTAFLGISYTQAMFGGEYVPYAVIYDILGTGIVYILYMAFQVPRYKGTKKQTWGEVCKQIVSFPPFIALFLGLVLLFLGVSIPTMAEHVLSNLSATLVPLAMISVGYSMVFKVPKDHVLPIIVGLVLKLILIPAIAWFLLRLDGEYTVVEKVSVLQAGMPPLITAGALAVVVDLEKELSMTLVAFGLLLSFLTLPFWV
jgi:predicted permease